MNMMQAQNIYARSLKIPSYYDMGLQLYRLHVVSEPFQGKILYFQFGVNCMKKLLILGAGAGGTMIYTKDEKVIERKRMGDNPHRPRSHPPLSARLAAGSFWSRHAAGLCAPKKDFISRGVNFVIDTINAVDPISRKVECQNGTYTYDWIIIGTGARIAPDEVPGLLDDWGGKSTTSTLPTARPPCTKS